MQQYVADMRLANYSPVTIRDRVDLLERFRATLGERPILDATAADLRAFQQLFIRRAPATLNIYSRHLKAFYDWAARRQLIAVNPAAGLIVPKVPRGRPHPTQADDLHVIFACTRGLLRICYVLACFAGLRRGEICRLQRAHLYLDSPVATALIEGKGGKERVVPLLGPVITELHDYGLPRTGHLLRHPDGKPMQPATLSAYSHRHLRELGVETTLHSMRHAFATEVARTTKDPMLVRDLLGHESLSTSQIYIDSTLTGAHQRLRGVTSFANRLLDSGPRLRAVT